MVDWDAQTILATVCALGVLIGLILLMHFYIMPTYIFRPIMNPVPIDWANITSLEG